MATFLPRRGNDEAPTIYATQPLTLYLIHPATGKVFFKVLPSTPMNRIYVEYSKRHSMSECNLRLYYRGILLLHTESVAEAMLRTGLRDGSVVDVSYTR